MHVSLGHTNANEAQIDEAVRAGPARGPARVALAAGKALVVAVDVEEERPFLHVPAVVAAPDHDVDLFDVVLSHVAHEEPAGAPVEGHAVRVPEAEGEDLLHGAGGPHERVVDRNAVLPVVGVGAVHVDAMDLPERVREDLRVSDRPDVPGTLVVRTAPVAHREVEHPVGPEREVATVVVELRPVDPDQLAPSEGSTTDVGSAGFGTLHSATTF